VIALGAAFLGENRVFGIVVLDDLDDRLFGPRVDLSHEIVLGFFGERQRFQLIEPAYHNLARAARGTYRNVDHPMHKATQRRILGTHKQIFR